MILDQTSVHVNQLLTSIRVASNKGDAFIPAIVIAKVSVTDPAKYEGYKPLAKQAIAEIIALQGV